MADKSPAQHRIEMRNIRKEFPGMVALDDVSFSLNAGEVHALLGENGAGKSTLIKILTGALASDGGEILLEGSPVVFATTGDAQAVGISTVYQEVNLIPAMSVTKNLSIEKLYGKFGHISWKACRAYARQKLARLGLDIDIEQPVGTYSIAIQQMIAIARALDDETKVLVLDEPTASLDAHETAALFKVIKDLRAKGMAIVFITHFLDQVYALSDRITVLRNGQITGTGLAADINRQDLITMMIGRDLGDIEHAISANKQGSQTEVVLSAKGLGKKRVLEPFDLDLRKGEAVGLAGLLGSGRTEMAKIIFGALKHDCGTLSLGGKDVGQLNPRTALDAGMAFCPEDRKAEGLIGELSVRENIIMSMQVKRGWLTRVPQADQERIAGEMIKALGIATPDADKPVGQLSGGNQQKVVLARALASQPRIMLLDEPTRGIDIGAHAEILTLIRKLCSDGMALLVASSELDEVVSTSDRVAVLRDRKKIGQLEGEEITRDKIVSMIAGQGDE